MSEKLKKKGIQRKKQGKWEKKKKEGEGQPLTKNSGYGFKIKKKYSKSATSLQHVQICRTVCCRPTTCSPEPSQNIIEVVFY